jgi:hypothetical protein
MKKPELSKKRKTKISFVKFFKTLFVNSKNISIFAV